MVGFGLVGALVAAGALLIPGHLGPATPSLQPTPPVPGARPQAVRAPDWSGWPEGRTKALAGTWLEDTVTVPAGIRSVRLQHRVGQRWRSGRSFPVSGGKVPVRFRAGQVGVHRYRLRAGRMVSGVRVLRTHQQLDAVGDVGLCSGRPDLTAPLVRQRSRFLLLGDAAYPASTSEQLRRCYDPHYGQYRERTLPVIGNHDYYAGDRGYFSYFGARAGRPGRTWSVKDFGRWRVLLLDSNCDKVGCDAGSAQYRFVKRKARRAQCLVAAFHHPVWSSGQHRGYDRIQDLVRLLRKRGADILVSGHEHNYERIRRGETRQFIAGTGGAALRPVGSRVRGSESAITNHYGMLRLDLHPRGYRWRFLAADSGVLDRGSDSC